MRYINLGNVRYAFVNMYTQLRRILVYGVQNLRIRAQNVRTHVRHSVYDVFMQLEETINIIIKYIHIYLDGDQFMVESSDVLSIEKKFCIERT